jgi:SulP family sulfate permease
MPQTSPSSAGLLRNLVVGLAISFVALSLGAAFGILSGRGAFAGMFSAGIIAILTSLLGGTRIQCSGPTAPMSVVAATVVALAYDELAKNLPGFVPDHFINIVFLLAGAIMLAMAILRLGRFIALVPNVVISGFMNGIALLIWIGQAKKLFGLGGAETFSGSLTQNFTIVSATLLTVFALPAIANKLIPRHTRYMPPATLIALVAVTVAVHLAGIRVGTVDLEGGISDLATLVDLFTAQWPRDWSASLLLLALPFALELALLCYLDTLLTSLVVDRLTGEQSRQDKELVAQGVANGAVALFGGIPGAQATIRSVLVIKEGGSQRIVGVFIGLFVLLEMVLFQDLIAAIPQAVFAGILFKAGYDVFDFETLLAYLGRFYPGDTTAQDGIFVAHKEMLFITGTTLVTVLWDLNMAVGIFTLLFYLMNKIIQPQNPIRDLKQREATTAV